MKTFKALILSMSAISVIAAAGCGNDTDGGAAGNDAGTAGDGTNNPTGVEGDIIDRVGRPGVSTALIGTFQPAGPQKDQLKNSYNEAGLSGSSQFTDEIANSLAIYDALAGTCGDNPITATGTGADTYNQFASALAQDQLLVNGDATDCDQYLAVELGMTDQCGGRKPSYDVINTTYSALAAGQASGVSDGVSSDDQTPLNSFPFLPAAELEEGATRFTVTVENVSQSGLLDTDRAGGAVPLSPGVWAIFDGRNPMFSPDAFADQGTARIAEDGFPSPPLGSKSARLQGRAKASGVFAAPGGTPASPAIFPGETATFTFVAAPGDKLSLETMFVQSNDWFYADDGKGIPLFNDDGTPISGDVTGQLVLWDAGTEQDTAPGTGEFQKPAQDPMAKNVGPNERVWIQKATERHPNFNIPANNSVIKLTINPAS